MTTLLADHNIEGHAQLLLGSLQALGWVDPLDLHVVTLGEIGLSDASSDREVWRCAQELGMLLLTDNRNRRGSDSLEQTLLEEHTSASLPVLTMSRPQRLPVDKAYRDGCAERVAEIVMDLDVFRGIPRLYIP